jgi:Gas vesicle protein K
MTSEEAARRDDTAYGRAAVPRSARAQSGSARQRLEGSGEDVGRSLGRLVVTLLEVVRQVIERQALRRVDGGDLTEEQVENLGRALIELEDTFDELRDTFGVREEDLFLPVDVRRLLDDADPARRRDDRYPRLAPSQAHRREST